MALTDKIDICRKCNSKFLRKNEPIKKVCSDCGGEIINTPITAEEDYLIERTSRDPDFFWAMLKLRENDIIEYQSRISQFRAQAKADGCYDKPKKDNRPKCPKCGSTSITAGARGVSGFWGFIGASKTVNRCANCGHTWKPGR